MSSGERAGVRERIDRLTRHLVESSQGRRTHDEARRIAVRSARSVVHGEKPPKGDSR